MCGDIVMLKNYTDSFKIWLRGVPSLLEDLIHSRLDFKFYPELWICVLFALLIVPAGMYCPVEYGYENGVVENTQMVLLFIGMVFCWFARKNKAFFRLFSAVIFILMLRETNFGKTVFYPHPTIPNKFLSWREIPYAPYVDPVMIVYAIVMVVYFIRKKLYRLLPAFIREGQLPVWPVFFMAASMIAGSIVDKACDNFVAEEIVELVFYSAFVGVCWRGGLQRCQWLPDIEK